MLSRITLTFFRIGHMVRGGWSSRLCSATVGGAGAQDNTGAEGKPGQDDDSGVDELVEHDELSFGKFGHGFAGCGQAAQLVLALLAELGRLVAASPLLRRDRRDAARRSRPSSSSTSARVAVIAATARPVAVAVSMLSRKARKAIRRSPRSAMVRVTSPTERPSASMAVTTTVSPARA